MARIQEFYKGRRKRRNYAIVPFVIVLGIAVLTVVLFYSMQQYAVITKEGIAVELPLLNEEKTVVDSEGNEVKVFDPVDVTLQFDEPDYSSVKATAGSKAQGLRAIFVPADNINKEKLTEYANRLNTGNALVLEMKPRSGVLKWNSQATMAVNYGISQENEATLQLPTLITELKAKNIYLVAQLSCCLDELLASRCTSVTLRNEYGGNYTDDYGTWLDAYNTDLRNYIVQLTREMYDMGFDEVVLADVAHPVFAEPVALTYTRQMSTQPSAVNAVCGFAMYVSDALRERSVNQLSIYIDSPQALVKAVDNGQDARLFIKVFDRVYLRTDRFAYSYNLADLKPQITIGTDQDRLIPVMENYLFENASEMSWVLVDVAE
ncbi:MAG: putative glycoside hydrolase [Eubacteriales bacterium]|nr:putative glycoside hydrolase [Eubacteriales bacterium]